MNKKKIISIIMTIALTVSGIIPIFGQGGDESGSTDWPYNLSISNSSLETTNYKLGTEKEFTIGYWPASAATAPLKGTRHITITGPSDVTNFKFQEDNQWQDISLFEKEISITTSLTQNVKVTFNEAGSYIIKFWVESGNESLVVSREFYVSDSGITRVPLTPLNLKEGSKKYNFQWSWGSDLSVTFDFYIDGQKINENPITETKYNASDKADILSEGEHNIEVIAIHMLGDESIKSQPASLKYTALEPETTTPETITPETTTPETSSGDRVTTNTESGSSGDITTEPESGNDGDVTTESESDDTGNVTTKSELPDEPVSTTPSEPASDSVTTSIVTSVETGTNKETTNSTTAKNQNIEVTVPQVKIKKAVKKKSATKAKIYLKKVTGVKSYEIQICKNKKFKKKNTITKKINKAKYTFKKLKPNRKYYVRVRGIVKNKNVNVTGKWSKAVLVKFKK